MVELLKYELPRIQFHCLFSFRIYPPRAQFNRNYTMDERLEYAVTHRVSSGVVTPF